MFLLEERARHTFSKRDLLFMAALAPLELFFYRPVIMFAQLKGTVDFLLGDRSWNKFERNDRGSPGSPTDADVGALPVWPSLVGGPAPQQTGDSSR